jgi:hypothetical protein
MTTPRLVSLAALTASVVLSGKALAQSETPEEPPPSPPAIAPAPALPKAPPAPPEEKPLFKLTPTGYVEAYYAYNFNRPSNGITNARGFDNRHNTFSLSNAVLGANWEAGPVGGRLTLQIGSTPSTYYGNEPMFAGASAANGSNTELWKYIQEAFVNYKAPIGRGLLVQLGIFMSPIGYESIAVKDNWNWSRSNLFFGFPFYHTGLNLQYFWTDELQTNFSVFNGWNSVVDNNEEKSIQSNIQYEIPNKIALQALYFGGVERPTGSPEGPYWRHHFDFTAQYSFTSWLEAAAEADYGWEPNRIGTARWFAGAAYARFKPFHRVYVVLRGDRFQEHLATSAKSPSSAPLFFGGAEWVSSGTATVDVRPHDQISFRLEYRHDAAEIPIYFGRDVIGDGSKSSPYVANARTQDTLLFGSTAWF